MSNRPAFGPRIAFYPFAITTVALVVATVLSVAARMWWFAELFSHFRVQYVAVALVLLAIALALRWRRSAWVTGTILIVNGAALLPYLPSAPRAEDPGTVTNRELRFVASNVLYENRDASRFVAMIQRSGPDVFAVLELTPAFAQALSTLKDTYPFRITAPEEGAFGIGLYSRVPLEKAEVVSLGETNAVVAVVRVGGESLNLIGTHLLPPKNRAWAEARNSQLEKLAGLSTGLDGRILVCGDFNLTPYSPYFRDFVRGSELSAARSPRTISWTWPVGFPLLALPIDHCMTDPSTNVRSIKTLGDIGSDHYPVVIDVAITTGSEE